MANTNETTPVVFRKDRDGDITAVFPCYPASLHDWSMSSYAHIGQHGGCSYQWYQTTRPASLEEYADLKAELESEPYGYNLKVYRRITSYLRDRFTAERDRLLRPAQP